MGSQSTREFTKVVIRQLPPTLQEADCKAAFDKEFADRYNWFSFSRGKIGCAARLLLLQRPHKNHAAWNCSM